MSSIQEIAEQLRACNADHVRAIIEPDDVMVLVDYLDSRSRLVVEEPKAEEPKVETAVEVAEDVNLESMTKNELLGYAESHGVEVAKSKTKAEIIEAIESENQ